MKPWPLDFARMVYRAAMNTRWERAAWRQLMAAVDAQKRARK